MIALAPSPGDASTSVVDEAASRVTSASQSKGLGLDDVTARDDNIPGEDIFEMLLRPEKPTTALGTMADNLDLGFPDVMLWFLAQAGGVCPLARE